MITKGLFTSNTDQWATPKAYFEEINKEFDFNLDPCADETNHKCDLYYDRQANGLSKNWGGTECTVTLHTVERLVNGLKNLILKARKITHL